MFFHDFYISEKTNQPELASNHPCLDFFPGTQDLWCHSTCHHFTSQASAFNHNQSLRGGPQLFGVITYNWHEPTTWTWPWTPLWYPLTTWYGTPLPPTFLNFPRHRCWHGRIAALSTNVGMSQRCLCSWQHLGLCPCVQVLLRGLGLGENGGCHGIIVDDLLNGLSCGDF